MLRVNASEKLFHPSPWAIFRWSSNNWPSIWTCIHINRESNVAKSVLRTNEAIFNENDKFRYKSFFQTLFCFWILHALTISTTSNDTFFNWFQTVKSATGVANAVIPTFTTFQYPPMLRTRAMGIANFSAGFALVTVPYIWLLVRTAISTSIHQYYNLMVLIRIYRFKIFRNTLSHFYRHYFWVFAGSLVLSRCSSSKIKPQLWWARIDNGSINRIPNYNPFKPDENPFKSASNL